MKRRDFLKASLAGIGACLLQNEAKAIARGNINYHYYENVEWLKLNTHVHTRFSNLTGKSNRLDFDHAMAPFIEDLPRQMKQVGLDAVILADHAEALTAANRNSTIAISRRSQSQPPFIISGFEWTQGNYATRDRHPFNHAVIANTPGCLAVERQANDCCCEVAGDLDSFYQKLDEMLGDDGFWFIPHPLGEDYHDFVKPPYQKVVDRCYGIEIAGGPRQTGEFHIGNKTIDRYIRALQMGWRVAPVCGVDNFDCLMYEQGRNYSGVLLSSHEAHPGETQFEKFLRALKDRNVFTSEYNIDDVYFDWSITDNKTGQKTWMGGTWKIPREIPVDCILDFYHPLRHENIFRKQDIHFVTPQYHSVIYDHMIQWISNVFNGCFTEYVEKQKLGIELLPIAAFPVLEYRDILNLEWRRLIGAPIWFE